MNRRVGFRGVERDDDGFVGNDDMVVQQRLLVVRGNVVDHGGFFDLAEVEPDPRTPRYLQTVWGHGYMFVPDAEA